MIVNQSDIKIPPSDDTAYGLFNPNDPQSSAWGYEYDVTDTLPFRFTITGTVYRIDKDGLQKKAEDDRTGIVFIQVESTSDGLPTGVYQVYFDNNVLCDSAETRGLTIPRVGNNVTIYGTWERGRDYVKLDALHRTVIPLTVTINS